MILTGAGASMPLGLNSMVSFMDSLEAQFADDGEARETLDRIYQTYERQGWPNGRDLEAVLERLNCYEDYVKLKESDVNLSSFVGRTGNFERFKDIIRRIRQITIKHIHDHYGSVKADEAFILFDPLMAFVAKAQNSPTITVFTTNYDDAIECYAHEAKFNLIDGFTNERNPLWKPELFTEPYSNDHKSIYLFKLHGSTNWYSKDGNIFALLPIRSPDVPDCTNVILYPAQVKPGLVQQEPFKSLYNLFRGYLLKTDVLLVIGHSLRDKVLIEAIVDGARENPGLSVVVINPSKEIKSVMDQLGNIDKSIIEKPFGFESSDYLKELNMKLGKISKKFVLA